MSKIEDALERTSMERPHSSSGGRLSAPLLPFGRTAPTVRDQAESPGEIACMQEPKALAPRELVSKRIIAPGRSAPDVVNAFRQLRTRVLRHSDDTAVVLMVTSVCARGGSSFVALNLAAALSLDEMKTALLIDCNLGRSGVESALGLGPRPGLMNYLEQASVEAGQLIQPTGIPRLRCITRGERRATATDVFTSARIRELLQSLKDRYEERLIIIDAPPILESADAEIVSTLCDYVLLVVPYGRVIESQILAAAQAVEGEKLLGVVFNNEPQ